MATQTRTQRQAAGKKAAATRKRNSAQRSAAATRASARRTQRSAAGTAKTTSRGAQRTGRQASKTTARGFEAATARLDAFGRQAERALLIQLGAAAEFRDAITQTAKTYTNIDRLTRELDRFERRGERIVGLGQRSARRRKNALERDVRRVQRDVERDGVRAGAEDVVERVKSFA
jgi:hypothetical protein